MWSFGGCKSEGKWRFGFGGAIYKGGSFLLASKTWVVTKIGKIHVQTAGAGGAEAAKAEAVIQGIKNRDEVKEEIKDRIRIKKGEPMPKADEKELLSKILDEIKGLRKDLKG
nr:hypothetical protein BSM_19630 [uncultured archaeon]